MIRVDVKVSKRYYITCPSCGEEYNIPTYDQDTVECMCGEDLQYDITNPEQAEE